MEAMSTLKPNIQIPVDLTNPGQFFACCGLLELADRLWPGTVGWFETAELFTIASDIGDYFDLPHFCEKVIECKFSFILTPHDRESLDKLSKRKTELKRLRKALPKPQEKERKRLSSLRIASGFTLGPPFDINVDWWLMENCDSDHLKTWAGPQAIAEIAEDMKHSLKSVDEREIFSVEGLINRKDGGKSRAPLSLDSGRVGTAQDIGYSADNVEQPIACALWTEFLALIAIQRFGLKPDTRGSFEFFAWTYPFPVAVAAMAARGVFPNTTGCRGRFRLAGRDVDNRFKAFQIESLSKWRNQ